MPLKRLFFITLLLFLLRPLSGLTQVQVQDSLALVALFNSTNGVNWTNNQNWLVTEVRFWHGVSVSAGRVRTLNLSANNLNGTLPSAFCDLTALEYMYFSDNSITGTFPLCFGSLIKLNSIDVENNDMEGDVPSEIVLFPDLADVWVAGNRFESMPSLLSVPEITNVSMENNLFTFEDIEHNIGILNFSYSPQDSVLSDTFISADIHDTITLASLVGGTLNQYQWKKNGQNISDEGTHIVGSSSSVLTINKVSPADSGEYICMISNPNVPLLTLTRRMITLQVNDTRSDQAVSFAPGAIVSCGDSSFKIHATSSSGLPLDLTVSSGPASLFAGDSIQLLSPGIVNIIASNQGNDFYKPISKDTTFEIFPHPLSGLFTAIQTNSPVIVGDSLVLSVPDYLDLNYSWEMPGGSFFNLSKLKIEQADFIHEGWYTITVSSNNCLVYSDSALIEILPKPLLNYYELVTPNGDGNNEVFYIENVEHYPDGDLVIFNIWNQILFQKTGYVNDWTGGELPSGTYYFTFTSEKEDIFIKGKIYIKR